MQHNVTTNIYFDILEFTMDDAPAITSQMVSGGCSYSAECHCKMFRISNSDEPFTCFCTHDVSVHEIIGVIEGGMTRYFGARAVPLPPVLLPLKETVESQRRDIFLPYAHPGSTASKRPSPKAPDRPPRSSTGKAFSESNLVNIICLKRADKIPTNDLERLEMGVDFMADVPLTTHAKLTKLLKMTSTLGEHFVSKYYIFVQDTKRSIRATKHWSCNFPDPATIVCLSRQPCIYILPDCYDDEELLFADSSEADFVEIISAGASHDEL